MANALRVGDDDLYGAKTLSEGFSRHAQYLLNHFYISLSPHGDPLKGKLLKITPPENMGAGIHPLDVEKQFVVFDFEYIFPQREDSSSVDVTIKHDVLNEIQWTPGTPWQTTYFTKVRQSDKADFDGTLLICNKPLTVHCDWNGESPVAVPAGHTVVNFWGMLGKYGLAGINHIVGWPDPGYDHLLFVSALVLAAASFWDVIKVVTAFTLAHTLTLSLSVLNLVSLPERIVEPMIAASIVFVALQNIFWPKRTRGWARLGAAFGFGLFHGLGFAGGLVNAMRGEPGFSIGIAIVAFSIGVEIGHQMVVLPLFGLLKLGRERNKEENARTLFAARALQYGSTMICVGGLFFLLAALKIIGAEPR